MLTVITGRSRRLWPRVLAEIGEAHAAGASPIFLIVPDQFTLQAELELVDRLHLPGLLDIEVLSPARLCTRVFTLAGSPQRVRVDARGKAMMIADVVLESADELVYYGNAVGRRGFAEGLATEIGNYKRSNMTPEDVAELAASPDVDDALRAKLTDIALLYARYEQRLEGAFIDGEDAQNALLERLPRSGLLSGASIWVHGFDLISPQFIRQLIVMAQGAVSVRMSLVWENQTARDGMVYGPPRDVLALMGRMLDEAHMEWVQERVIAPLDAAPEIQHLEQELYAVPPVVYERPVEAITLSVAANPYDEAMRAAAEMLTFARGGMSFDKMVVVLGEAEGYAGAIETAFGRSGIPYYLARKRPALSHPLIRAWLAGIRCATLRWRAEDALDWLKGGFCGLDILEAERLENYAIENGLRGPKWKKPIDDPELESIRIRFAQPLEALQGRLRAARDNTASLSAVYALLEDVDAYGTLEAWERMLTEREMLNEAAGCAQAWRLVMETLDQLHALLRGSRMRMAQIAQVIESGLAAAELGSVPASPGIVQVGQLGHMKISGECRVLFLLGLEDGVMRSEVSALVSDEEVQRVIERTGEPMAFGLRGDSLAQLMQMNLLDTLATPSERLFISHAVTGPGGEAQRPAPVLKLLRRVFPQLREQGSAIRHGPVRHAAGAALDALGPMLRQAAARGGEMTEMEAETAAWLLHSPKTRAQAEQVLRALEMPPPPEKLGRRASDAIYAHTRTSISRLETYAACPFQHYIRYGLRPVPRKPFEIARDETGTFFHRAMEGYTQAAMELPGWPDIDRTRSDALMDKVLAPLTAEWEDSPMGAGAMQRAAGAAFCRIARRSAWAYAGQTKRSGFRTGVIEARFGPGEALPAIALLLPGGQKCWVEGRIDRIDFLREEDGQWLRVVDYKSGQTTLEPGRVYSGLQLQLLLYLSAALAAYPGVEPAGAFYSKLEDPLVELDSRDVDVIETKLAREMRLSGIALSDVRVVRAMDGGEDMISTTSGEIKKTSHVASEEELSALMIHAYELATQMAGQIAEGDISARPAQLGTWRACQWCDYRSICGFDATLEGHETRQIEKISEGELLERVRDEHGT